MQLETVDYFFFIYVEIYRYIEYETNMHPSSQRHENNYCTWLTRKKITTV